MTQDPSLDKAEAIVASKLAWAEMTNTEKAVVRMGMIPLRIVDKYLGDIGNILDAPRLLSVELMRRAEDDGGMRV